MLVQRVITALVLLALIGGAMAWSPAAFDLIAALAIGLALWEWLRLAGWSAWLAAAVAGPFMSALLAAQLAGWVLTGTPLTLVCAAASAAWVVLVLTVARARHTGFMVSRPVASLLAVLLLPPVWWALEHFYAEGVWTLLSVVAIVWVADVAAYFAGRAFGRSKLAPAISPGKTWAGVWGAMAAVLGAGVVLALARPEWPLFSNRLVELAGWLPALLVLATLTLLSVVGDLFESQLKRNAGVKDSSRLLPGHGGVYDRIDALIPVLPAAVLLESLFR